MLAVRAPAPAEYRRRTPEREPLYQALAGHLETFLAQHRAQEQPLPRHIEQELRAYLECGILAYGFVRLRCTACGGSRLIAFSCKRRGFCPSCLGRRMADIAAHLVDHVLPHAPVRQWVLSLPYELRYRLAWDRALLGAVLAVFLRLVAGWYRAQARRQGHPAGRTGAVTFVQRFGSSLNLNPHLHVLMPDGVWVSGPDTVPTFVAAHPPTEGDIQHLVERTAQRLVRLLQRRGLLDQDRTDPLAQDQPLLAALTAAAVQGTVATGPRAGQRLRRRLADPADGQRTAPLCYAARGFSLHAATRVPAHDRTRLEHLCRYVLRPPLAAARLRWLDPDTLSLTLKTPWADGTTHLLLSPHELLEKLAALVPPPRQHLIRYHGVLAPHAADRGQIVPAPADPAATPSAAPTELARPWRQSWACLLARVFRQDLTLCPACGGPMRLIAAPTDPDP
ncbi:MAG: transposase, partial [Candidatus Latescibacterota bacterium]